MMNLLPDWMQCKIVVSQTGCWIWQGKPNRKGYCSTTIHDDGVRRFVIIHRYVYGLLVKQPGPRHVHHLCEVRACCNPAHLELLTPTEHAREHGQLATHCSNGHEWTSENTYIRSNGDRQCRACKNDVEKRRIARMTPKQHGEMIARSGERRRQRRLALCGTTDRRTVRRLDT